MKFAKIARALNLIAPLTALLLASRPGLAVTPRSLEAFDITKEPTPADWRYFIKAPGASREQLWAYHASHGRILKDWSWGWRLGWVRVCGKAKTPLCQDVLRQALLDRALVVRAEAATRLGRLYEGTANADVISLLTAAYGNDRNFRRGKPLFVQNRILYALHQIGGDEALASGERLSARQPSARAYWAKLTKADD